MKKNITIIALIILLVFVSLFAYKMYEDNKELIKDKEQNDVDKDNKNNDNQQGEDNKGDKEPEEVVEKPEKIDSTKDYVYDGKKFRYAISSQDSYVPYINLDSDYAKMVNDYLNGAFINTDEMYFTAKYEWHLNGNVLSVVVRKRGNLEVGKLDFWTNIDINTGKQIKLSEVLTLKNISTNSFNMKAENAITSYANTCYSVQGFKGGYTKLENGKLVENNYTKSQFIEKTVNDLPSIDEIPFYLDANGNIRIVADVISCSGPSGMTTKEFQI